MTDCLRHRGPDDSGLFVRGPSPRKGHADAPGVALGHRRLSILDLSSAGRQPLSNEDGSVLVVFNGEIYNFQELRAELQGRHEFRSHTDTEVLVHLYEDEGSEMLARLRGMFALAIYDLRTHSLLLARDRVGKKPLYYSRTPDGLFFGSEIKAILAGGVSRKLDVNGLDDLLHFGYVPGTRTLVEGVREVPAGHYLYLQSIDDVVCHPYWKPVPVESEGSEALDERAEASLVAHLDDTLREAVRLRLRSDVPVGAFLSGGLDSSLVVSYLAELCSHPVRTFSIGFQETEHDERSYARIVAKHFGTRHEEFVVTPNRLEEVLSDLAWHFDNGLSDTAAIPTWYLSQMTRREVKVALSGDGADELFAGYSTYLSERVAQIWGQLPGSITGSVAAALQLAADYGPARNGRYAMARAAKIAREARLDPLSRYLSKRSICAPALRGELFRRELLAELSRPWTCQEVEQLFAVAGDVDSVTRLTFVDTLFYLPYDMLPKVDRASMAHGLEVRCPFLDAEVVDFALRLHPRWKLRRVHGKRILRRLAENRLPEAIIRRRKHGFTVPLRKWFRDDDPFRVAQDRIVGNGARCTRYLDKRVLTGLFDRHRAAVSDLSSLLWTLLLFDEWLRVHDVS